MAKLFGARSQSSTSIEYEQLGSDSSFGNGIANGDGGDEHTIDVDEALMQTGPDGLTYQEAQVRQRCARACPPCTARAAAAAAAADAAHIARTATPAERELGCAHARARERARSASSAPEGAAQSSR